MKSKFWNKFLIFLLFLGMLVLTIWLYIRYKPVVANPIPQDADAIVCIDVANLRNELVKEYFSGEELNAESFFDIRKIGLKIPNYVIGFTCLSSSPETIFISFDISDSVVFNSWTDSLVNENSYSVETINSDTYIKSPSNRFVICANENKTMALFSMGLNLDLANIIKVSRDIFENKNLMTSESPMLKTIRENKEIGFIWIDKGKRTAKESMLFFDFEKGKLSLDGNIFLNEEYQFEEMNNTVISQREQQAYFYFNGGSSKYYTELCNKVDRKQFEKLTNFSVDSLLYYADNSINFSFYDTETLADTSVTYEYDDDFNKVEKIKINKSIHPVFDLTIPEKKEGLFRYLKNDSSIKQMGYRHVFTPYPFTTVYAYNDNGLVLSTAHLTQFIETKFPNFLELRVNFSEIDSVFLEKLGVRNSIFENKIISLRANQISDSTRIVGSIKFN